MVDGQLSKCKKNLVLLLTKCPDLPSRENERGKGVGLTCRRGLIEFSSLPIKQ